MVLDQREASPVRDKKHEELKNQLIKDVFGDEKSNERVPIEKVTMLIWHCRDEPRVVTFMARFLTRYAGNRDVFDGIEFYLPQLAHMIIHVEANWDDAVLEQFALTISQHSLHFALQLNWILQGAIEDYQPETREGEPNPSFNALFYTRCVKLLAKLERSVVYGRAIAQELHRLYEKGKISKKEYEAMELADRRFNAAQIMEHDDGKGPHSYSADANPYGGWLLYKRRSRKNWHKRKQWRLRYFTVSDQMLYCHDEPPDGEDWSKLARAMPLEGAEILIKLDGKYEHMFEVHNQYYLFKLRAGSKEELDRWMRLLREEAERSALFSHRPKVTERKNSDLLPADEREKKNKLVSDLSPTELARYTFFTEERAFVRDMCDVCEKLRFEERDARKRLGPGLMEKLGVPPCSYVPMCNNTDVWRRIVRFLPADTKVINTRERCPVIMIYVNEVGSEKYHDDDIDVADFLHREFDAPAEDEESMLEEKPSVVDGDVFHSVCERSTVSTVWAAGSFEEDDHQGGGRGEDGREQSRGKGGGADGRQRNTPPKRQQKRFQSMFQKEMNWLQIPAQTLNVLERSPTRKSVFARKSMLADGIDHEAFPVRSVRILESTSADGEMEAVDNYDPIDEECLNRAKRIICGGETWAEKSTRLSTSVAAEEGGELNREIGVVMAKSNDDIRQEVFVMQMIHYYHSIFVGEGLPIWLKTYRILSCSKDTGMIEYLKDATSIDGLKKSDGYPKKGGMLAYFNQVYGDDNSPGFQAAQHNFMTSLVGYSLVCYLLGLKDRHNGNVMIDTRGRIIHIDFGFAMGMAPGHEFSFERAPFKMTTDYMDVMGGPHSKCFAEFRRLFVAGFEAARSNSLVAMGLVEIMMYQSNYPCFSGPRYGGGVALRCFQERLMLTVPDRKIKKRALELIE